MKWAACLALATLSACGRHQAADQPPPSSAMTITAEDIERSPGMSLEQLLVARIPGVTLARAADGRLVIHVRGTSTLRGAQEPLVVVDGIPLRPNPVGNLRAINPHDIASVEVLKDAAGTAMYGVRGGNGVIVIKTKRADQ
jgi:TonB-dependent SusC/RagA subfamily outer membrane receptor